MYNHFGGNANLSPVNCEAGQAHWPPGPTKTDTCSVDEPVFSASNTYSWVHMRLNASCLDLQADSQSCLDDPAVSKQSTAG